MKRRLISLFSLLFFLIASAQFNVAARAGGGHGGGGHGGGGHSHSGHRGGLGFFEFLCIVGLFCAGSHGLSVMLKKRARKKLDASGVDYPSLKKKIAIAYFLIQKAWAQGDMTSAKEYMTQRLFEDHQKKLEKMARSNKKNICENIELLSITPWRYSRNGSEKICVKIKGRMIDYIVKVPRKDMSNNFFSKTWTNIRQGVGKYSPKRYQSESFEEFWTFVKNSQGNWQLDRIS